MQLTGRHNYTLAGQALGYDLVARPETVSGNLTAAFRTAGWYWTDGRPDIGNFNDLADLGDIKGISHAINGGEYGLTERIQAYNQILQMFGGLK